MNQSKIEIRKTIIKLHEKGKRQTEISELLDIPQTTISFWIKRYKKTSLLNDLPRSGKPSKLTKKQFEQINHVLHDFPPSRYGGESIGWTTKMLMQFIKDNFGVTFGMRYVEKIMHRCGISLITPRSEHSKASYAARIVYRMEFKKNSKKNMWIAPSLISTK